MSRTKIPEFYTCWPSIICVAVCAAWRFEPPNVLMIQVDEKRRPMGYFKMRFQDALRTAR